MDPRTVHSICPSHIFDNTAAEVVLVSAVYPLPDILVDARQSFYGTNSAMLAISEMSPLRRLATWATLITWRCKLWM